MPLTGTEVFYGDYQFKPAPLVTVSREKYQANDGATLGGGYVVTLQGTLLPGVVAGTGLSTADVADHNPNGVKPVLDGHNFDGIANAMSVFRAKDDLLYALNKTGEVFKAAFLGTGPLCSGYAITNSGCIVRDVSFDSPDQWVKRANYTVEIFFPNALSTGIDGPFGAKTGTEYDYIGGNLAEKEVDYNIGFASKNVVFGTGITSLWLEITRTTSSRTMQGLTNLASGSILKEGLPGEGGLFDVASGLIYETAATGNDLSIAKASGFRIVHTAREHSMSLIGGSYSYTDTFYATPTSGNLVPSGTPSGIDAIETFSVDTEATLQDALITVNIQGEVRGLETFWGLPTSGHLTASGISGTDYQPPFYGGANKNMQMGQGMAQAQFYLDKILYHDTGVDVTNPKYAFYERGQPTIFNRAETVYSGIAHPATQLLRLQSEPISKSFSYNIYENTIGYNISYSNRPENCYSGALSESITVSKKHPDPIFASLTVLGRTQGPLFQDIGTKTAEQTDVNIEALVVPHTGYISASQVISPCTGKTEEGPNLWIGSPTGWYQGYIDEIELGISGAYGSYYRTSKNETYDPRTGRYTLSAGWIYTPCDDGT